MDNSQYTKIYNGNFILITRIKSELENAGIIPIIKDETESGRLAGFGSTISGLQEIYVNNEELKRATEIIERVKAEVQN